MKLSRRLDITSSIWESFKALTPQVQCKNPVMFVTYIGAITTTIYVLFAAQQSLRFNVHVSLWLWFTVLFANFAQSLAESHGKAHAANLRKKKVEALAKKLVNGVETRVPAMQLQKGDLIVCTAGDIIAADGDVIDGIATVDESAITGESAPVIRESGGDRSAVTAGTKVVSDRIVFKVTSEHGFSFLDRMISLIEGAKRQKTPNEIALHIVLSGLTIIFLLTVSSLKFFADFSASASNQDLSSIITLPVLIALLVCLIPTTISALLSAIGIAGMDRLISNNVIATSGRSVEAAGDVDLLILDKTGTITMGNRMAAKFYPVSGMSDIEFATIAQLASLADETPEGRSIVVFAKRQFNLRAESFQTPHAKAIPFSAKTRLSGIDIHSRIIRKGAVDAIKEHVVSLGGAYPEEIDPVIQEISRSGGTPLLVSLGAKVVGAIYLKDVVKGGIKERFMKLRAMGISTVMVTGDNPRTAAYIAAEAGVDDYIAEATPDMKLELIKQEQEAGRLVAMTGDGTNDAPALAQADVGVAMNTGTQASREAGNMVDLDSNPTKLLDIVEAGKQLLMTRGALTTFSLANDVAKYFAIIPAMFGTLYCGIDGVGPLSAFNVMQLGSPESAILSTVIYNALIIIALIPLALRGVHSPSHSAQELLRNNILIYGLGGLITPFIGIKLIDMLVRGLV